MIQFTESAAEQSRESADKTSAALSELPGYAEQARQELRRLESIVGRNGDVVEPDGHGTPPGALHGLLARNGTLPAPGIMAVQTSSVVHCLGGERPARAPATARRHRPAATVHTGTVGQDASQGRS